jgi:hypothetical protein
MRFGAKSPRPPQWLGHSASRPSEAGDPSFAGEHSHFDIAAKAASLLRHSLPVLVALPVEAMLRKALIRAPKPLKLPRSGIHTAGTVCVKSPFSFSFGEPKPAKISLHFSKPGKTGQNSRFWHKNSSQIREGFPCRIIFALIWSTKIPFQDVKYI